MPQKFTIKEYAPESYYHVFSRGANKQNIFCEATDYKYFLNLLDRYLGSQEVTNKTGSLYPNYSSTIAVNAFCLMPNHIHLLLYQDKVDGDLRRFMSSLMTSYSKYFNHKYNRTGSLFESRYKAKRIESDEYLVYVGSYIHLNPRNFLTDRHTSLRYVMQNDGPSWLDTKPICTEFRSKADYLNYLGENRNKKLSASVTLQLADH